MKALVRALLKPAYVAQLVSVAGSATLTILSTWILDPEDRGRLAVVVLWMTLGSYACSLGMPSEFLKMGTRKDRAAALRVAAQFMPVTILTAVSLGFLAASTNAIPSLDSTLVVVASSGATVGAALNMVGWYDYGSGSFTRSTLFRGMIPLAAFIGIVVNETIGSGDSVLVGSVAYTLASLLAVAYLSLNLRGEPRDHEPHRRLDVRMITSALRYFAAQSTTLLWIRAPILVSSFTQLPAQTAVLSLSSSIAEIQGFLPQMRAAITFREAAESSRPRLTRGQVREVLTVLVPGSLSAVVLALVMAASLPAEYNDLGLLVLTAIPGAAALSILGSVINVLAAQGRSGAASVVLSAGLVASFSAMFILLPRHAALGLSVWSALATVLLASLAWLAGRSTYRDST